MYPILPTWNNGPWLDRDPGSKAKQCDLALATDSLAVVPGSRGEHEAGLSRLSRGFGAGNSLLTTRRQLRIVVDYENDSHNRSQIRGARSGGMPSRRLR